MRNDAPASLIPPGEPFRERLETRIDLRIGDAERDAAVSLLREHFAAGRLTLDELTERIDGALAAKTERQIGDLLADLPQLPRDVIASDDEPSIDSDAGRYLVLLLLLFALAAWLIAMLYMASAGGYGGPPG